MTNETKILSILETLAEGQERLERDVGTLKQDVSGLKQGQERLEQDVVSLKQDVQMTKEIVINLENDQGYKITALFDAYQANEDAHTETRQRMSECEKRCDKLELDVMVIKSASV